MRLLVIRHSNRHRILSWDHLHSVPLTDRGRSRALQLGDHLKESGLFKSPLILTSYASRCYETGFLTQLAFSESSLLRRSKHSIFTTGFIRPSRLKEAYLYLSRSKGLRKTPEDMFINLNLLELTRHNSLDHYFDRFFEKILKYSLVSDEIIVVSHDIVIAPLMHYVFTNCLNKNYEIGYPKPLEGFLMDIREGQIQSAEPFIPPF